jgi:uncharacterized protein YndB with AHSA1/START domain
MGTQEVSRHIGAPAGAVWAALVDPVAVEAWRAPEGMDCRVHEFVAVVGGPIRVTLIYQDSGQSGKSGESTDTYHGRIVALEPLRRMVEELEFETDRPEMAGRFRVETTLEERSGSTLVTISYSGLPSEVSEADNRTGSVMALDRLARLVEGGGTGTS